MIVVWSFMASKAFLCLALGRDVSNDIYKVDQESLTLLDFYWSEFFTPMMIHYKIVGHFAPTILLAREITSNWTKSALVPS